MGARMGVCRGVILGGAGTGACPYNNGGVRGRGVHRGAPVSRSARGAAIRPPTPE